MLLRVQSPWGCKRIECNSSDSTQSFIYKIQDAFQFEDLFSFDVFKDRNKKLGTQVPGLEKRTLEDCGLRHGDMVFLFNKDSSSEENSVNSLNDFSMPSTSTAKINYVSTNSHLANGTSVEEDEVDKILTKQNGLIEIKPDEKLCQHGNNAKCVHCAPLEPYDENYMHEHNIKHMSFHSYLRKITGGIDKGKFAMLENISCKIKPGCKEHAPWPNGICTKCQPSAITLNRQIYRHVDNIEFENSNIPERFLNYWRTTGHQRIGFLYGYYTVHKDVPLGIKATVVAIYEPPQESSRDYVKLTLPDKNAETVDYIATKLGFQRVGWIFTDLIPEGTLTVKNLRNMSTHFLSAQECIMAGHFQNMHPNNCRLSPDGFFGSKFVTVCVTGDINNQIQFVGYQVSNQCMALVNDNCLLPTKDAPELGYVRESSNEQYVPDAYYKEKDDYGNEVIRPARPLPIEYLLVDVPVATPIVQHYTFSYIPGVELFPTENRSLEGHIQDFNALSKYLSQTKGVKFSDAMNDFHLLIYIATMDALPMRDTMEPLLQAVKTKNENKALEWSRNEQWATVEQLVHCQSPETSQAANEKPARTSASNVWACAFCTFENDPNKASCDMCNLPRN